MRIGNKTSSKIYLCSCNTVTHIHVHRVCRHHSHKLSCGITTHRIPITNRHSSHGEPKGFSIKSPRDSGNFFQKSKKTNVFFFSVPIEIKTLFVPFIYSNLTQCLSQDSTATIIIMVNMHRRVKMYTWSSAKGTFLINT